MVPHPVPQFVSGNADLAGFGYSPNLFVYWVVLAILPLLLPVPQKSLRNLSTLCTSLLMFKPGPCLVCRFLVHGFRTNGGRYPIDR